MNYISGSMDSKQPAEAPWIAHYPRCVPPSLDYPREPAWWFLEESARRHPARVACQYYEQKFTFGELCQQAHRAAALLAQLGVKPGDRVGLLLPNCPEYLIAAYGVWMAGGVIVSLSPLMVAEEVSTMLSATECRIVIGLDLLAPLLFKGEHHPEQTLLVTLKDRLPYREQLMYFVARLSRVGLSSPTREPGVRWFSEELKKADPAWQPIHRAVEDPAYILPTGGTTGIPKAVVLSHRNLVANAWQLMHWAGGRVGKESFMAVIPFFHSYGMSTCVTTGIAMGATLILHHRFKPQKVVQLIERHQPSFLLAVPALLVGLNEYLRKHPAKLRSLRYCISGGAPLDQAVAEEFIEYTGATVVEGYGLSEAGPVTHVGPLDGTNRMGTIGLPLPDTEVRVVDAETGTRNLPAGEVGELVIRAPQVMLGYWKNPEETAQAIRHGWLFTGDLGTFDADGFFRIVDRKKDLIITSGFNVYPNEVEEMLRRFPGVCDAAVIGMPDPHRGEIVKALLTLEKGQTFDRKAFDHFVGEHLAKHKRPRVVQVLSTDLPRTFLGKVQRRKLREVHGSEGTENLGAAVT